MIVNSIISTSLLAAGSWSQKADFPFESNRRSISVSTGSNGYVGMANIQQIFDNNGGYQNFKRRDFYKYEPSKDLWTQVENLPEGASPYDPTFYLNGRIYIVTDTKLWAYSPPNNQWVFVGELPKESKRAAFAFSLNGYAFLGGGSYNKEMFWRYTPENNQWEQMNSLPDINNPWGSLATCTNCSSILLSNNIYVTGTNVGFWKYNFNTDSWTQKSRVNIIHGRIFAIDGKGYAFNNDGEVYQYNEQADSWDLVSTLLEKNFCEPSVFVIGSHAYIGLGGDNYDNTCTLEKNKTVWEFTPLSSVSVKPECTGLDNKTCNSYEDVDKLLDLMEDKSPALFGGNKTFPIIGYWARYYSDLNLYLGSKDREVYGYGDRWGGFIHFGNLDSLSLNVPNVLPSTCLSYQKSVNGICINLTCEADNYGCPDCMSFEKMAYNPDGSGYCQMVSIFCASNQKENGDYNFFDSYSLPCIDRTCKVDNYGCPVCNDGEKLEYNDDGSAYCQVASVSCESNQETSNIESILSTIFGEPVSIDNSLDVCVNKTCKADNYGCPTCGSNESLEYNSDGSGVCQITPVSCSSNQKSVNNICVNKTCKIDNYGCPTCGSNESLEYNSDGSGVCEATVVSCTSKFCKK